MWLTIAGKMFTTGRIIFASLFVIVFVSAMVFSYRKDSKNNTKYYKSTPLFVGIGILIALGLLFLSKYLIKS